MTTTSTSTTVAVAEPVFSSAEQLALAGFLAGYTGLTREAYALDLRQYATWCQQRHLRLFEARRACTGSLMRNSSSSTVPANASQAGSCIRLMMITLSTSLPGPGGLLA